MSTGKRTRRSPEEAKRLILDAAEVQLRDHGPAGLRLQEVAAQAGVSHPTILHHFGNREGLVSAIVERTVERVGTDIVDALESTASREEPGALLERIYTVLQQSDHAKLMSWLVLSGHRFDAIFADQLQKITDALHEIRPGRGRSKPPRQDTLFLVMLATLATLGDAVAGDSMYKAVGLDKAGGQAFRRWLGTLVRGHVGRRAVDAAAKVQ